jgi:hypothetical protein
MTAVGKIRVVEQVLRFLWEGLLPLESDRQPENSFILN